MSTEREPTHKVFELLLDDPPEPFQPSLYVYPLDGTDLGRPVQLTDLLVNRLRNAHEAVLKAEADIRKWLERTEQ